MTWLQDLAQLTTPFHCRFPRSTLSFYHDTSSLLFSSLLYQDQLLPEQNSYVLYMRCYFWRLLTDQCFSISSGGRTKECFTKKKPLKEPQRSDKRNGQLDVARSDFQNVKINFYQAFTKQWRPCLLLDLSYIVEVLLTIRLSICGRGPAFSDWQRPVFPVW